MENREQAKLNNQKLVEEWIEQNPIEEFSDNYKRLYFEYLIPFLEILIDNTSKRVEFDVIDAKYDSIRFEQVFHSELMNILEITQAKIIKDQVLEAKKEGEYKFAELISGLGQKSVLILSAAKKFKPADVNLGLNKAEYIKLLNEFKSVIKAVFVQLEAISNINYELHGKVIKVKKTLHQVGYYNIEVSPNIKSKVQNILVDYLRLSRETAERIVGVVEVKRKLKKTHLDEPFNAINAQGLNHLNHLNTTIVEELLTFGFFATSAFYAFSINPLERSFMTVISYIAIIGMVMYLLRKYQIQVIPILEERRRFVSRSIAYGLLNINQFNCLKNDQTAWDVLHFSNLKKVIKKMKDEQF